MFAKIVLYKRLVQRHYSATIFCVEIAYYGKKKQHIQYHHF